METIGKQELKAKLDANEDIKLVMTVGGWTFRAKHIPGSLSFPSPGRALQTLRCDDEIPRRKPDAGLAGGHLPRSGRARISSYFRSL